MLFYLDNWQSVAPAIARRPNGNRPQRGLNENYARELMELHTLGVDGGYTQKDVTEVARCFTGWTIRNPQQGGDFFYNDRVHDKGEKIVLGYDHSSGRRERRRREGAGYSGESSIDGAIHFHGTGAAFRRRRSSAGADRSHGEDLPDTHGDIREVMRTMLESKEFFSAGAYHAKVKTPLEMIASAVRATDARGRLRISAGAADRQAGRAAVSQRSSRPDIRARTRNG